MLLPLARGAAISEADAVCEPDVGLRAGLELRAEIDAPAVACDDDSFWE
jgi:hypothetical protein